MPSPTELLSSERLELARRYLAASLSVIPIWTNGSKAPALPEGDPVLNRQRLATDAELTSWFGRGPKGIGILAGALSGGLEVLDFDDAAAFDEFAILLDEQNPDLLPRLPQVLTPRGGRHVYYRCAEIAGNTKLAQDHDGRLLRTLIETRGEGGYVLAPGSPRACHRTSEPYVEMLGCPITRVPTISDEERSLLWSLCRSLNRHFQEEMPHPGASAPGPLGSGTRPGDEFNRNKTWAEVLEPHGWTMVRQRGDICYWRRPGKEGKATSATTGKCSTEARGDLLYVFSSNAMPLEPNRGYSKFEAYAFLNHGGDFHKAAAALNEGTVIKATRKPQAEEKGRNGQNKDSSEQPQPTTEPNFIKISSIEKTCVNWSWLFWMPEGSLTIFDGDPGLSKSTVTLDLAARVTRGWAMPPNMEKAVVTKPRGVLLLNDEDDPASTVRPRFEKAGGDVERLHLLDSVSVNGVEHPPVLPWDLELVENHVRSNDVGLIIVDPFLAYLESEIDSHKDQSIRQVTRRLSRLARKLGVAILLIRHLNKLNGGAAIYRGGGSIAIVGSARAAWVVGRDPEDKDVRVLAMNKTNLGPMPRSLTYTVEAETAGDPHIVWGQETDLRPDDILTHESNKPNHRPNVKVKEAEDLLRDLLKNGPVATNDVYARSKTVDIGERTMDQAKKNLGVVARRVGWVWTWSMPEAKP